jgi:cardiolipin synthase
MDGAAPRARRGSATIYDEAPIRSPRPYDSTMPDWLAHLGHFFATLSPSQRTGATLVSIASLAIAAWAIVRALSRGHGVQGTLTWVFAILAFPLVGAAAFFAFASPSVKKVRLRRRRAAAAVRHELGPSGADPPRDHESADSLIDLATSLTGHPPTAGNEVALLTDDSPTFERIEHALRAAKRSIWAEYYIIRNDMTGRRFLALLHERARDGLEVRLLFDALGSMSINAHFLRAIVEAGGHVRSFQPMNPLRRRLSVHLRNHRKLVVVDGEHGFTGGMNVGDEYSGRRRKQGLTAYRDSHLELRGPAVGELALAFVEDWTFSGGETLKETPRPNAVANPGSIVNIVPSGPDQEHNASAMVHFAGVAAARRRAWLTSPYFIPDEATLAALVSASLRRVDVKVLVPSARHNNISLAALAAASFYGKLLRGGVRIYEYEPAMLHAKTLAVDGQVAFVGSANVDIRSFRLNFEIGALVADPIFVGAIERRFVRDLAHANEVTLEDLARRSVWTKAKCSIARLLAPIL